MTLCLPRKAIKAEARRIGSLLLEGVHSTPTDLREIGKRLRVRSFAIEDLSHLGELRRSADGFTVVTARYLSTTRRRFTIAHELGHAALEMYSSRVPLDYRSTERLCDAIAAEILMPADAFKRSISGNLTIKGLVECSNKFNTSITATALRLTDFMEEASVFQSRNGRILWTFGPYKLDKHPLLQDLTDAGPLDKDGGEVDYTSPGGCRRKLLWHKQGRASTLFLDVLSRGQT